MATDGQRNFSGMLAAWVAKLGGVTFNMVPYSAMPQGIQDTVAGRVQVVILAVASAQPHMRERTIAGDRHQLAERAPGYEQRAADRRDVPRLRFSRLVRDGGADRDAEGDHPARERGNGQDPQGSGHAGARWSNSASTADGAGTPESTGQYIKAQYDAWGKVVKEIGLVPE